MGEKETKHNIVEVSREMHDLTGFRRDLLYVIAGADQPSGQNVKDEIELIGADPLEEATVVTDHSAEGSVDTGVMRFRFSGQMSNVHVVDWNSTPAPESPSTPEVHIEYGVPDRSNSN